MAMNNIISFGNARSVELKDEHKNAVQACRQILLKTLPRLLEYLFERMDDTLYRMADQATNNAQQTSFFDAMRELRIAREGVENSFNTAIIRRYEQFWREGPGLNLAEEPVYSLSENDLSLLENEDLEETLAVNNMITKGESLYFRELYALDQRFGHMLGGVKVEDGANPVSPTAVAYCFKEAVAGLDIDLPVKLVVYKQFEQEVIGYLGNLYDQMNDLLAGAGIVPRLQRRAKRNPVSPALRGGGGREGGEHAEAHTDDYADYGDELQSELFATLQNLLNVRRGHRSGVSRESLSLPVYETAQVLNALSSLQHSHSVEGQVQPGATLYDIRTGLVTSLKAIEDDAEQHRIGQVDEDAIDVIAMLFEFILEDRNLHEAMKAQLACLQIPMLKVAILDKRFFSNKAHPARRLLNSLAQAAVGWTEANGREPDGVYDRISRIVRRIVDEFEDDLSLFEELNRDFNSYLEKESKSAAVAETRVTQVTQGKEQLNQAKLKVFEEINLRLSQQQQIPEVVSNFLREGWKDVLLLIALKSGIDSSDWDNAMALTDDLIWSVSPKQDQEERQKLLKLIPALLKGIRQGLNNISYNQHQMTTLFKELQIYHVRCLRGVAPENEMVSAARSVPAERKESASRKDEDETLGIAAEESAASAAQIEMDEFDRKAREIEVGSWLEMTQEDGQKTRSKLSWRSNVTNACLFVNRRGLKVAELSIDGLAMLLREGKAAVLGRVDKPLMDRALDAMISTLSKTGSDASPKS